MSSQSRQRSISTISRPGYTVVANAIMHVEAAGKQSNGAAHAARALAAIDATM
jgi:DNA-binding winged helix-turn-helix (wHTH) protein